MFCSLVLFIKGSDEELKRLIEDAETEYEKKIFLLNQVSVFYLHTVNEMYDDSHLSVTEFVENVVF